ncbi:MAG: Stp1/IreP family PP2C-type Ser/Thr phosphatase [Deltaproteobacteria bacterium]|nr:Stp1/IreP family PP2C-type Ser/Thr phosphatase [Deltaproteobacteria bacterium]
MAIGGRPRPTPFPSGMKLGDHYRVEGLVRLAEGRMFYLLNDDRPDQAFRTCLECGYHDNPREERTCLRCGAALADRRFLMSVRWDTQAFGLAQDFFERRLVHPAIATPIDLFVHDHVLCSVIPYRGESLLLDESSPLSGPELLRFAQRVVGTLAFLCHHGIRLAQLGPAQFLFTPANEVLLWDLDVEEMGEEPIPPEDQGRAVQQAADLLARYAPVDLVPLWDFLERVEAGEFLDLPSLGSALQGIFAPLDSASDPFPATAISDVGLCRDLNEDSWAWTRLDDGTHLFVVADGMGGHASGEVASALAARTLCRIARERIQGNGVRAVEAFENILDEAFQIANNTVKDLAERRGNDMGTTLVALLIIGERNALIANVGDSRGYLLRDKVLHQITHDHSLVARMVEQNRITPEEARNHPHSNILLRTVGTERNVEIDIFSVEIEANDRILLCSDGLWGEVEDEEIESILNHYEDPRVTTRELVRAAHHGGGKDNITIVLVEVGRPR